MARGRAQAARARSRAAVKGWVTRRANAARAARAAAARRGWATRRTAASKTILKASLRSDAAKRGWTTRRATARAATAIVERVTARDDDRADDRGSVGDVGSGRGETFGESGERDYAGLDDFIDDFESWDGDFVEYDVETGVDYGEE